jgi:hypothetical protein
MQATPQDPRSLSHRSNGRALLEGVDILLLTPSLSPYVRGVFLSAMTSIRKTE